jgi:hypothetical protein
MLVFKLVLLALKAVRRSTRLGSSSREQAQSENLNKGQDKRFWFLEPEYYPRSSAAVSESDTYGSMVLESDRYGVRE